MKQIETRKKLLLDREFVPSWKHLKTYINNRCWEEFAVVKREMDNKEARRIEIQKDLEEKAKLFIYCRKQGTEPRFWEDMKKLYNAKAFPAAEMQIKALANKKERANARR